MHGASRSWKKQGRILPYSLWREHSPTHILISDFWPLELGENKLLLFVVTQFVVLCHSSHRKQIQTIFPYFSINVVKCTDKLKQLSSEYSLIHPPLRAYNGRFALFVTVCPSIHLSTHLSIFFLFHYSLLQDIEYSSLCYTVGPCCWSNLFIVVCIC